MKVKVCIVALGPYMKKQMAASVKVAEPGEEFGRAPAVIGEGKSFWHNKDQRQSSLSNQTKPSMN
ncbi:MAG: hypothetical protein R3C24_13920 [Cyanobacteriota/Melainabacteria group bacterium]